MNPGAPGSNCKMTYGGARLDVAITRAPPPTPPYEGAEFWLPLFDH